MARVDSKIVLIAYIAGQAQEAKDLAKSAAALARHFAFAKDGSPDVARVLTQVASATKNRSDRHLRDLHTQFKGVSDDPNDWPEFINEFFPGLDS